MDVPHTVQVLAPAKVNLALHVTGQRADGYHLLESLVAFASVGDTLTVTSPGRDAISLSGPFGPDVPMDGSNFIFRIAEKAWPDTPLSFHLHKELPVASGIGGGSADAAACYRAIALMRRVRGDAEAAGMLSDDKIAELTQIGADVPMCVHSATAVVQGIGEEIAFISGVPELPVLLVNPGVGVSTPAVFNALATKENAQLDPLPASASLPEFCEWLSAQRNDLEPPACNLVPQIRSVLDVLGGMDNCRVARMSGSGATCFGIFHDCAAARAAQKALAAAQPDWWVRAARLNGPSQAAPHLMRSTT